MKVKTNFLVLTALVVGLGSTTALGQTTSDDPTQLGSRQIEVRTLDVSYDLAYRSATQALLSLGYAISHSDKPSGILTGARAIGVTEMKEDIKKAKEEMKQHQEQVRNEQIGRTALGFVPYVGWLGWLLPGSKPPEREIKEPSKFLVTMLLQAMGDKETQIRFKMQKDGEPVWDQVTIDRLWVTTQREALIESGPPPTATNPSTGQQGAGSSNQKPQEPSKK